MTTPDLATLEKVSLREAWPHEAHNFTPWLLANLDRLSEAVGIALEPEDSEVSVGTFSADILARSRDGGRVLIENQLECSDHTHLGQILTYLSGLEAKIVIWVASDFRQEHLSALSWLNDSTNDEYAFFAVKVEVVRIADSPFAPLFEVIERPNEWERLIHTAAPRSGTDTKLTSAKADFWNRFTQRYPHQLQKQGNSNWWRNLDDLGLVLTLYTTKGFVGFWIRGPRGTSESDAIATLDPALELLQREFEAERIGPTGLLEIYKSWEPEDSSDWEQLIDWLMDVLDRCETLLYSTLKKG